MTCGTAVDEEATVRSDTEEVDSLVCATPCMNSANTIKKAAEGLEQVTSVTVSANAEGFASVTCDGTHSAFVRSFIQNACGT